MSESPTLSKDEAQNSEAITTEEKWKPDGPGLLLLVPVSLYMASLPLLFFASLRFGIGLFLVACSPFPLGGAVWKWFKETPEPGKFRSQETQQFVLSCIAATALMATVGIFLFFKPDLFLGK